MNLRKFFKFSLREQLFLFNYILSSSDSLYSTLSKLNSSKKLSKWARSSANKLMMGYQRTDIFNELFSEEFTKLLSHKLAREYFRVCISICRDRCLIRIMNKYNRIKIILYMSSGYIIMFTVSALLKSDIFDTYQKICIILHKDMEFIPLLAYNLTQVFSNKFTFLIFILLLLFIVWIINNNTNKTTEFLIIIHNSMLNNVTSQKSVEIACSILNIKFNNDPHLSIKERISSIACMKKYLNELNFSNRNTFISSLEILLDNIKSEAKVRSYIRTSLLSLSFAIFLIGYLLIIFLGITKM